MLHGENNRTSEINSNVDQNRIIFLQGLMLIGFILALFCGSSSWAATFFKFFTIPETICTGILFVLHLFHVPSVYRNINWLKIEFIFCGQAALLLACASLLLFCIKNNIILIVAGVSIQTKISGFIELFQI